MIVDVTLLPAFSLESNKEESCTSHFFISTVTAAEFVDCIATERLCRAPMIPEHNIYPVIDVSENYEKHPNRRGRTLLSVIA